MSDPSPLTHLLIPGAGLPAAIHASARPSTPQVLPHLQQLMQHMAPASRITCEEDSPATPCELALAALNGLVAQPGLIPWAAFDTGTIGTPCAWIKPGHWQAGADHILLVDPADLALDEATSRTLFEAAAPYCLEDGITLTYVRHDAWLATGEAFRGLPTRSLARVIGRRITPAVFDTNTPAGVLLRRLQNEMQMLFYTHPVNDARQARGLLPVNSFWITGAGVLDQAIAPKPGVEVEQRLQAFTLQFDPQAHAQAWAAVDADACARLLAQLKLGIDVRLTLCGNQQAQTYQVAAPSLLRRIKHLLGLQRPFDAREQL